MAENTKMMIKNARLSYANLFEPRAIVEDGPLKYSVSVLIDKSDTDTINAIVKIVRDYIKVQKWTDDQKKKADITLRDGKTEKPEDKEYENVVFLNAKSDKKPLVVDQKRQIVSDYDTVYSGCYANVYVSFYPFDKGGNKGVGVGLLGVQKVKDGEPLGSIITPEVFEDVDDSTGDVIPFDFI